MTHPNLPILLALAVVVAGASGCAIDPRITDGFEPGHWIWEERQGGERVTTTNRSDR